MNNNATQAIQNLPRWIIEWLNKLYECPLQLEELKFPKRIYIDFADAIS